VHSQFPVPDGEASATLRQVSIMASTQGDKVAQDEPVVAHELDWRAASQIAHQGAPQDRASSGARYPHVNRRKPRR
jgi:hypothetical protein